MIPFNRPALTGGEKKYMEQVLGGRKFSGDGYFTMKCCRWFQDRFQTKKAFLTPSCTHALELSALLVEIKAGDEVIMPSFTFSSTANAFALRGAKIVFVDIRPYTMNMDETLIEKAITHKTKALVPVHYAGVACEMDKIMSLAGKYGLYVIEDAAQGVMSKFKGRYLGTIGHLGCYSFHETKNYQCGEGGALLVNDDRLIKRAEIIREKGTNRSQFFRGEVDKYSWVDVGSSYLLGELSAAFLYAQLEQSEAINWDRMENWHNYYQVLENLQVKGLLELPLVPEDCEHNGHIFYLKTRDREERDALIKYLKQKGIMSIFHYVPLHSSRAGEKYGRFHGKDSFTTKESRRLLRLPIYYGLLQSDVAYIASTVQAFYECSESANHVK